MTDEEKPPMKAEVYTGCTIYTCPCGKRKTSADGDAKEWIAAHEPHTSGKVDVVWGERG